MSDDVNITSGGAIAVDSSMVRDIGSRVHGVGVRVEEARDLLRRAGSALVQAPGIVQSIGATGLTACAGRLGGLAAEIDRIVFGCSVMADTFELVELRAQRAALSAHHPIAAAVMQAKIVQLVARAHPGVEERAQLIEEAWVAQRYEGTEDQFLDRLTTTLGLPLDAPLMSIILPLGGFAGSFTGGVPQRGGVVERLLRSGIDAAVAADRGVLPAGTRLTGAAPPVDVRLVRKSGGESPANLEESLDRIPNKENWRRDDDEAPGQIAVEKYTMDDDTNRFVVYIDGTRTVLPDTDEPWDMGSNWDMYMDREKAASQQAVLQALEQAGAKPGDRVDPVGYSQGGAIASFTAMDSPYTTEVVILAGSPTEPWLTSGQTIVQVAHAGDFVHNLQGVGSAGGSGSADSFTVTRDPDSMLPWNDHDLGEYVDTARMADESGDVRVRSLHESYYAELARAKKVEVMEFAATRP